MQQHVFLSGSSGFIGKNFLALNQGCYRISAPTRAELELTNTAAVDHYFAEKKFSALIHAASTAISRKNTVNAHEHFHETKRAFSSVFKQHHAYDRFIQLGSGAEYGRPIAERQIVETAIGQQLPTDEYGLAKLSCTQNIMAEAPNKAVSLHLFGVFGPHEDYQVRFISNAIVRSLARLPIIIHQNVEFDYVYVNDVIRILQHFIEKPAQHTNYNMTTGQPITLVEIADIVRNVIGHHNDIIVKNAGLAPAYTGSNQRLKIFLGADFQFTPIKQAIAELASWYEKQFTTLNQEWITNPL